MPKFRYKVRNRQGEIVTGTQNAASKATLIATLKTSGFTPLAIQPLKGKTASPARETARPRSKSSAASQKKPGGPHKKKKNAVRISGRVRDEDLLMFTRELESVIRSGVPILAGLRALSKQAENPVMQKTIAGLASDVESGLKLSETMKKYPRVFSEVFVSSVMAGETSGQLSTVLNKLGKLMEHSIETKANVTTATRYPMIVLAALAVGSTLIVNFVLPKFATFYTSLNATLPLPSRILIGIATTVHQYWIITTGVMVISIAFILWYIRTPVGKYMWHGLVLKFPIFGPLYLKIALTKFATTLETLYASGVTIVQAFEITSVVVDNVIISRAILRVRQDIMSGESMAASMQKVQLFPPLVIQMVASGEQTGNLDQHLRDIAEHYDHQVRYTVKNLTTLIEPILTVVLGGLVLMFALAVFLPMWNMMGILRR